MFCTPLPAQPGGPLMSSLWQVTVWLTLPGEHKMDTALQASLLLGAEQRWTENSFDLNLPMSAHQPFVAKLSRFSLQMFWLQWRVGHSWNHDDCSWGGQKWPRGCTQACVTVGLGWFLSSFSLSLVLACKIVLVWPSQDRYSELSSSPRWWLPLLPHWKHKSSGWK